MIPITKVEFGPEIENKVVEVLRSGIVAQGPVVAELEALCSKMASTDYAVAVNNGTTALVLALKTLNLRPGDEVITSPFTFVATLNAILETGASVRFAEIGSDYNIDVASIEPLINERTRAIVPVHLYGLTAKINDIMKMAKRHNLAVVEDCAQAHFAETEDGTRAGQSSLGCFSFYATKNLAAGEGGVVTTNSEELADQMRVLRNQGMRARYQYEVAGHNFRMTDLAAAVVVPQFSTIAQAIERRQANAKWLNSALADLEGVVLPTVEDDRKHVYHQYTIRLLPEAKKDRDELADVLSENQIGFGFYYPKAVYDYDCYRNNPLVIIDGSRFAEDVAASVISLPVHPFLTENEREFIATTVSAALK